MRVFICGIIQGSLSEYAVHGQSYRTTLKGIVEKHMPSAEVYCPVSLHPESLSYDDAKAFEVLEESIDAARKSDLIVAYLPEASMGSAIEMWEAKRAGARIISITPLKPNWVVRYASDIVVETIGEFEELLETQVVERLLQ
ncbi:MAG: hypothetical protein ABIJ00_05950 [Candidatus Eisenbacteria bacterium]